MPDTAPWLTLVTVVKDDPAGLRATLASLVDQDLSDVEYVVIDGSADRDAVPDTLAGAPLPARCTWQQPRGIYAAMNTGLEAATGSFVYFANAGDALIPGVLERVRPRLDIATVEWGFGSVGFRSPDSGAITPEPGWSYPAERRHFFARRRFPPHQGTFMRTRELRRQGGFDESFRITADYLAMLRASEAADPVVLDEVIAVFETGGASTTSWREGLREFHRARLLALEPQGIPRLHEQAHTVGTWVRTAVYRGVLAR